MKKAQQENEAPKIVVVVNASCADRKALLTVCDGFTIGAVSYCLYQNKVNPFITPLLAEVTLKDKYPVKITYMLNLQ